ncbi:MAG TPA: sugar ABC transporter substrate-binding protein [Candidatus Nanoarchaeia archaeon]|nr:sugar ABC transporter substrate-binding protein [Candidatus Nanoarchaeia archaeon]
MNKKILIGTAIAIVLVLAGSGGYFWLMAKKPVEKINAVTPPVSGGAASKIVAYVGYSTAQPFWVTLGADIKAEADRKGLKFVDLTPQTLDPQEQKRLLDVAVNSEINGIILGGGGDPTVLKQGLDKALALGIPVITVDTEIDHPAVKGFIATDNFAGAVLAGDYIVKATGGKGTVLILGGTLNHPNGDARRDGVKQEVEKAGMKVIYRQADFAEQEAYQDTEEELSKPNDISAIFAAWDPGILAADKVVQQKKLQGKIIMSGFDGLQPNLIAIKAGDISSDLAQPIEQIGTKGVDMIVDLLAGKQVPKTTLIPGFLITKDNVDNYLNK